MIKLNIVRPKPDKKDPEKVYWRTVGELIIWADVNQASLDKMLEKGISVEMHDDDTSCKVFAPKDKGLPDF